MPPAIPDRWTAYKACGQIVEGTRFICFKVPLEKNVQVNNKEITEIWDIPTLLSRVPNLGAVIDLTNTNRYYNPLEFQKAGVQHRKILIPGREIPPNAKIKEFMNTVDKLLEENSDNLIGVHCTHGLNRTGFLVCRYMRDRMDIPGNVAIKKFEKARGYQMERDNYVADIMGKKPPPPQFGPDTKVKPVKKEKTKPIENCRLRKEKHSDEPLENGRSREKVKYDTRTLYNRTMKLSNRSEKDQSTSKSRRKSSSF